MQPTVSPPKRTAALLVAAAFAVFALIDVLAFRTGLYHAVLDPASSTGSFETAIKRFRDLDAAPKTDVLVLGDSRIYSGLNPQAASAAAPGLRFLNGGVPGTTPRCWPFFVRAIDPQARRFRAVVIAVDTYADDDSAIGSLDGDDRPMDLRYVVFQTRLGDLPKLAGSFSDPRERVENGIDLFWRGQELRDDVQAFAANPLARFSRHRGGARHGYLRSARRTPAKRIARRPEGRLRIGEDRLPAGAYRQRTERDRDPSAQGSRTERLLREVPPPVAPADRRSLRADRNAGLLRADSDAAGPSQRLAGADRIARRHRAAAARAADCGRSRISRSSAPNSSPTKTISTCRAACSSAGCSATTSARDSPQAPPRSVPVSDAVLPSSAAALPVAPPEHRDLSWFAAACGIGIPLRFQSYEFWLFFAVICALFYLLPRRAGFIFLLIASYYFYARWNAWYVLFLWILTASDFLIAIALEKRRESGRSSKLLLALGVAANLGFLGSFKYTNFASSTAAALIGMHGNPWLVNLFVPIGISFHTFQSISYLVDVYRGRTVAIRKPLDYALYLAFFPQLLAGPIVRAGLFFGELFTWRPPGPQDVTYGLARAGFGLLKKTAIADQFAGVANGYFDAIASHPGSPAAWSAMFAFSMQIYFDFSGYSDIAIGCARMLGFVFPENFRMPYLATSVTDFWHRWHITLSTWLRDYLYIPLGGNRGGALATLRNLMITMLLGGLWHGAQWTFVAWGGVHGVALCIERLLGVGRERSTPRGVVLAARVALTFAVVTLAWVLFRAPSFADALTVYRAMFAGGPGAELLDRMAGGAGRGASLRSAYCASCSNGATSRRLGPNCARPCR